ncbi:MAG: hypothetical protein H0V29_09995 [Thermoleophilaceae bacterium]|nr:hypothetical protein [Thermoleophilaceae bacterium]
MPGDEWRVEVKLADEAHGQSVTDRLRSLSLDDEAREKLGRDVIVTRDDLDLFLYSESADEAKEAERVIRELLSEDRLQADVKLTRWHPVEESWNDASQPLPSTEAERASELERKEARETVEAVEEGDTDWDVRATLGSHSDTTALADRLEAEGLPVVRRWRHLFVKTITEEDAEALAVRLRKEGAEVEIEARDFEVGTGGPFRFFAGIGG